ncbi:YwaF family protein [Paenibacillus albus]|uniref:TIGR02206 family membrane protein n=1 Tax=Paenibacillus albus TaxID=2495582 RepID=A0A3S9A9Q9_9BACL|nr:TIGR02206 family membrane protein [Paenibacillus albus]AZN42450.1 TIGR02206 family membrane protein [Paenibacillus albus]
MDSFFSPHTEHHFVAYAGPHLFMIAILLGLALLLFLFRRAIRERTWLRTVVRVSLLIGLVVPEAGLYYWYAAEQLWNTRYTLPLELCSISQMLAILLLITRSRLLYQIVYFAGIGGALQAIFTPDLDYPFPHFRFFHFFIVHTAIILAPLYLTWVERYRPTWKSIGITMIFLNILVIVVGGVDFWLDANYMFLRHKPAGASLLSVLGPYPYYLLFEEAIAVVIFGLMYLPFVIGRRLDRTAR